MNIQTAIWLLVGVIIGFSIQSVIFKKSIDSNLKELDEVERKEFTRLVNKIKESNK